MTVIGMSGEGIYARRAVICPACNDIHIVEYSVTFDQYMRLRSGGILDCHVCNHLVYGTCIVCATRRNNVNSNIK